MYLVDESGTYIVDESGTRLRDEHVEFATALASISTISVVLEVGPPSVSFSFSVDGVSTAAVGLEVERQLGFDVAGVSALSPSVSVERQLGGFEVAGASEVLPSLTVDRLLGFDVASESQIAITLGKLKEFSFTVASTSSISFSLEYFYNDAVPTVSSGFYSDRAPVATVTFGDVNG